MLQFHSDCSFLVITRYPTYRNDSSRNLAIDFQRFFLIARIIVTFDRFLVYFLFFFSVYELHFSISFTRRPRFREKTSAIRLFRFCNRCYTERSNIPSRCVISVDRGHRFPSAINFFHHFDDFIVPSNFTVRDEHIAYPRSEKAHTVASRNFDVRFTATVAAKKYTKRLKRRVTFEDPLCLL